MTFCEAELSRMRRRAVVGLALASQQRKDEAKEGSRFLEKEVTFSRWLDEVILLMRNMDIRKTVRNDSHRNDE